MDRPGSVHATAIRETTRQILETADKPIAQYDLAMAVAALLDIHHLSPDTMRRRLKEAIALLVAEGMPVVSDARGYRIARTPQDRAAGRRYIMAQLAALGRRLRSLDASAGDRVAQLALELDGGAQ